MFTCMEFVESFVYSSEFLEQLFIYVINNWLRECRFDVVLISNY